MYKLVSICIIALVIMLAIAAPNYCEDVRSNAVQSAPTAPRITYPSNRMRSLNTNIAWFGDVHDACEVRIGTDNDVEKASVWQSGEVKTAEQYVKTPDLPGGAHLFAFARIHNAAGWSPWSEPLEFDTPALPYLRLIHPVQADRIRGGDVEVSWELSTSEPISNLYLTVDGEITPLPIETRSYKLTNLNKGVHKIAVRATLAGRGIEERAAFYIDIPDQQPASKLYKLDLTNIKTVNADDPKACKDAFDTLHLIAVLQGVVNRANAQLYINYTEADKFWLGKMTEKYGYLEHVEQVPLKSVEEAVDTFKDQIKGVVVWDPSVPSTNNVASTICGVENLIPVRFDETPGSMYDRIIKNGPKLKVVHNLVGMFTGKGMIPGTKRDSTGSKKCDSYLWAKINYLDTGKCNPLELGYWCDAFWLQHPKDMGLDNVGITNHDFIVARKGFICDLNCWPDEAPRDEPNQRKGLDRETLQDILLSCYKAGKGQMIHFTGFTPWAMKYTNVGNAGGTHDAVPTEWETAQLASAYNAYMDADAIGYVGMANASVFSICKLPDRLIQNPPPSEDDLESKGYMDQSGNVAPMNYVYHYLGDYDSAAWMYNRLPEIWKHPVRGQVPSGWAFNPNLIERLPIAFDWFYNTKTANDYFVGGDSGAGYVNPTLLLPPRNPSNLDSAAIPWIDHNMKYYRKLNYSITGFLINGFCGRLTDDSNRMYTPFSGDGVMTQLHWMPEASKDQDYLLDGMPVAGMKQDICAPVEVVVDAILKHGKPNTMQFLSFRSILIDSNWIKTVNDKIQAARPDCRFEPVDPYTYFYLLRHTLNGSNEQRATYTFDDMPDEVKAGETIRVTVGIRNDGWDMWKRGDSPDSVYLHASFSGRQGGMDVPIFENVLPKNGTAVTFDIQAPSQPGKKTFYLEMKRGSDGYFGNANDMPWEKQVVVK